MASRLGHERLHVLGIRHHGPGSTRSMLRALDAADPEVVLIEGPPEADPIIPFAASPGMRPPLAMLIHSSDDPSNASFYPFAEYSPEWQALRWALAKARPVRFIDLPAAERLAERARPTPDNATTEDETRDLADTEQGANLSDAPEIDPRTGGDAPSEAPPSGYGQTNADIRRDPLAYLAQVAGYEDSEAWWNALIEQGAHAPDIFPAIETAMTELRAHVERLPAVDERAALRERRREAHMRLRITEALKETSGAVAVVCGAWHVPALRKKVPGSEDRALLKGLARLKVTATWVPWTDTRLTAASGYGAGITSPGWYAHLWQELAPDGSEGRATDGEQSHSTDRFASRWQARVAALLRKNGWTASTASVIEAVRLSTSLAALRGQSLPGLDEMREASLATLCAGEAALWHVVEQRLVIGNRVGDVDAAVPQMPLQADLALWQKRLKLKPEALDREISLDLRSDSGLAKSLLLHRLDLIDVPWGRLQDAGSSRGTFREVWTLRWQPELSVKLAEAVVHGTTIAQAAGNRAVADARSAPSLDSVSKIVRGCLLAGLEEAANATIAILQRSAANSSDIVALAGAVPPLADILRYGTARAMPTSALAALVHSLAEAVCAGLVYACRNLQESEADTMRDRLAAFIAAVDLLDGEALPDARNRALRSLADDEASVPLLRGLAARSLYEQAVLSPEAASGYLSRALSPSVPPLDAGRWLDGFLGTSAQVLIHDHALRSFIDTWLSSLGDEDFMSLVAMLRRAFSGFDRLERRRLLDEVRAGSSEAGYQPAARPSGAVAYQDAAEAPGFAAALPLLLTILAAEAPRQSAKGDTP